MMDLSAHVLGLEAATALLAELQAGVKQAAGEAISVGSTAPYAWGVEYGRRRNGQLARRAGGAFMFSRAMTATTPQIAGLIAAALPKGAGAVKSAQGAIAGHITQSAMALTPVVSGNLRKSLYSRVAPRSASFGGGR